MIELQSEKSGLQRAAMLLVAALAAFATGAFVSQTSARSKSSATSTPAGSEVAPRGQRTADEIKFGDWQKVCFKAAGAKTLCRTTISGTLETGQVAVRLDLIEREGAPVARLQSFVPIGMYLRIPVKLSVDGGEPYRLAYNFCVTNSCLAGEVADPRLIREMETGNALALEVVDVNFLSIKTTLPLAQFAMVHKGSPAQTFEQDIDE